MAHIGDVSARGFRVAESPCSRGDPQRIRIDESGTIMHGSCLLVMDGYG
jgi:hypothetical protein